MMVFFYNFKFLPFLTSKVKNWKTTKILKKRRKLEKLENCRYSGFFLQDCQKFTIELIF